MEGDGKFNSCGRDVYHIAPNQYKKLSLVALAWILSVVVIFGPINTNCTVDNHIDENNSHQDMVKQITHFFKKYYALKNFKHNLNLTNFEIETTTTEKTDLQTNTSHSEDKIWSGEHKIANNEIKSPKNSPIVDLNKPKISPIVDSLLPTNFSSVQKNISSTSTPSPKQNETRSNYWRPENPLPVPGHLFQAVNTALAEHLNLKDDSDSLPGYLTELKAGSLSDAHAPARYDIRRPLTNGASSDTNKKNDNVKKTTYYYEEVEDEDYMEEDPTHLSIILDELTQSELLLMPQTVWNGTKEMMDMFMESFEDFSLPTKMILLFSVSVSVLSIILGIYSMGPPVIAVGVLGILIPIGVLALLQTVENKKTTVVKQKNNKNNNKVGKIIRFINRGYNTWG